MSEARLKEFSTPTVYSDDTATPFEDISLEVGDDALMELFQGATILDIGSGAEGVARKIEEIDFAPSTKPLVVNLNPQFSDWRMIGRNTKRFRHLDIKDMIAETMELYGEDSKKYFAGRVAVSGIAQQLSFSDNSFDFIFSTWSFPNCLFDCGGNKDDFIAGLLEIDRTLKPGGEARLAPIRGHEEELSRVVLDEVELKYEIGFYVSRHDTKHKVIRIKKD